MDTTRNYRIIFIIALLVLPSAGAEEDGAHTKQRKPPLLTVKETLHLARFPRESYRMKYAFENSLPLNKVMRGDFRDLVERANPAAAEKLYIILKDAKQDKFWWGTVMILGQVDGKEAIGKFEAIIFSASNSPKLAMKRRRVIDVLSGTLASMCAELNIPEARKKLNEMLTYQYWHTRRKAIGLSSSTPRDRLRAEYDCIVEVLYNYVWPYVYSSDPGFPAKARSVLKQVKEPEQKKLLSWHIERIVKYYHGCIKQKKEREDRNKQKKKIENTPSASTRNADWQRFRG